MFKLALCAMDWVISVWRLMPETCVEDFATCERDGEADPEPPALTDIDCDADMDAGAIIASSCTVNWQSHSSVGSQYCVIDAATVMFIITWLIFITRRIEECGGRIVRQ